jgi:hypothetical protein
VSDLGPSIRASRATRAYEQNRRENLNRLARELGEKHHRERLEFLDRHAPFPVIVLRDELAESYTEARRRGKRT